MANEYAIKRTWRATGKRFPKQMLEIRNPARETSIANRRKRAYVLVEVTLRLTKNARGDAPEVVARWALKQLGYTASQVKEMVKRYQDNWPNLDWLAEPLDRDMVRTAAGEQTRLVEMGKLAAYQRTKDAARERTTKRHVEENPERKEQDEMYRRKAERLQTADWPKEAILDC